MLSVAWRYCHRNMIPPIVCLYAELFLTVIRFVAALSTVRVAACPARKKSRMSPMSIASSTFVLARVVV
jgi:hypothetical protein